MEVFRTIRHLRTHTAAAGHIKFPSLPSVFSESIAIAATPLLFGPGWRARYGGRTADVLVENTDTGHVLRVEVKATGRHAFQELKGKDLRADFLLWIRFGTRLESGSGPIEVALLESPGKYVTRQCRLDVRRLEAIPGLQEAQRLFRFESLKSMLTVAASRG